MLASVSACSSPSRGVASRTRLGRARAPARSPCAHSVTARLFAERVRMLVAQQSRERRQHRLLEAGGPGQVALRQ